MDLLQIFQPGRLMIFLLVALRTSAAMSVGPLAAWPGVPVQGRVLLGLAIALAIAPTVPVAAPAGQFHPGVNEMVQELILGLLVGVASTLIVSALQLAAGLIDFQAGFTFGASIDPMSGNQTGPIEHFLNALAAVLFLDLNGHQLFLIALDGLFQVVPVGGALHLAGPTTVASFFSAIFIAALAMALPIVTLLLLVDVALAMLSRAAPQFNLLAIGFPVRVAVALLAIAVLLPVIATQLGTLFGRLPDVVPILIR